MTRGTPIVIDESGLRFCTFAPAQSWASVLGERLHFDARTLNHGITGQGNSNIAVRGVGGVPWNEWDELPEPGYDDDVKVLPPDTT